MQSAQNLLVVVDSPVARQLLAGLFSKEPDLRVVTAFDWTRAQRKARITRPDLVVLCSDRLGPQDDSARWIRAEQLGLLSCTLDVRGADVRSTLLTLLARVRGELVQKKAPSALDAPARAARLGVIEPSIPSTVRIVAMGASVGGTSAIKAILQSMPLRAPGIVIVQHMPEPFTAAFAMGLDRICTIAVKEAAHGDVVREGTALIAPGNRHLIVHRRELEYYVDVVDGPLVMHHRPSVNVLLRSVAQAAGPNAVGVVLTGMGDDGADGLLEMKEAGAFTVAQNEESSAVFGMPRAAIVRGGVLEIAPLLGMRDIILKGSAWRGDEGRPRVRK